MTESFGRRVGYVAMGFSALVLAGAFLPRSRPSPPPLVESYGLDCAATAAAARESRVITLGEIVHGDFDRCLVIQAYASPATELRNRGLECWRDAPVLGLQQEGECMVALLRGDELIECIEVGFRCVDFGPVLQTGDAMLERSTRLRARNRSIGNGAIVVLERE